MIAARLSEPVRPQLRTPSSGPGERPVPAMTERAGAAVERAVESHHRLWGAPELVSRAPGRVNLIGDHTDYNDGFVLPMAIRRDTAIAVSRNPGGVNSEVVSEGFGRAALGPRQARIDSGHWAAHIRGVSRLLGEQGVSPEPWRASIATDVPIGAGLSSSAALEVAMGQVLLCLAGAEWSAAEIARLGQRVENEILGLPSGIMDQLVSASAVAGHALMIDCRSLQSEPFAVPAGSTVAIMDTNTRRPLVGSAYAERRESCERAAVALRVQALRDADLSDLERLPSAPATVRLRARHVITENRRTLDAARAMALGDAEALGALMSHSHVSLRDDFEVSSPALDQMVEIAHTIPGCLGARMTGGGFAGCAVALVCTDVAEEFCAVVEQQYRGPGGIEATVWVCEPASGGSVRAA